MVKKNKYIQLTTSLFFIFSVLLSGCQSTKKTVQKNDIKTNEVKVPLVLESRPLSFDTVNVSKGRVSRVKIEFKKPIQPFYREKLSLADILSQKFDQELGKIPGALVDRRAGETVKSEAALNEMYGGNRNNEHVDYVIFISANDFIQHKESEVKESLFSDDKYRQCDIEVGIKGWGRVYSLPSVEVISQWEIEEDASTSFDIDERQSCDRRFKEEYNKLISKITENAVCESKHHIKNTAAPIAFIGDVVQEKNKTYYLVNFGRAQGVDKGDSVKLYHQLSQTPYATGSVVSLTSESAKIKIDEILDGETIYLSDYVRTYTDSSFINCIF
jgi:hypothetical protein